MSVHPLIMRKQKIHTHRSRKYRKRMHVEASTQITHSIAEEENITLIVCKCKTEKYDSSSNQLKIIGFTVFNILGFS
jgi:hypothetical protein